MGIGLIEDETVRVAGLCGGGLLTSTGKGESLELVSPLYPCNDVVFQYKKWKKRIFSVNLCFFKKRYKKVHFS